VSLSDIVERGGASMMTSIYENSPSKALQTVYPEINWQIWRFEKVPNRFWDNLANQRDYMNWIANHLDIKCMDDWYKVSSVDVINMGERVVGKLYNNSIITALETIYPEVSIYVQFKFICVN
jgi:hypothetical protein